MVLKMTEYRTYRCQGILQNDRRCSHYVEYEESDGLFLCETCHNKHIRAIGSRLKVAIMNADLR
jgi:Zn finger protein HypA/HybF involved in hydrogenase expression